MEKYVGLEEGGTMTNQPQLYQLYRQMTGRTLYQVKPVPAMPEQVWQESRIKEYAFIRRD
jgi:hypothetical protein